MYCLYTSLWLVFGRQSESVVAVVMERYEEERKQTRGGRVLMIGNPFQVIIPFQSEVGIPPLESREPTKLGTQTANASYLAQCENV